MNADFVKGLGNQTIAAVKKEDLGEGDDDEDNILFPIGGARTADERTGTTDIRNK